MSESENVYFYVNGVARLLMSCVIAQEVYPKHRKYLVLLHQYGYTYDSLLPHVRDQFAGIYDLRGGAARYSHADQFLNTYFNRYSGLREFFQPRSDVIVFGIRSPQQKFVVRHNKAIGNVVKVYAESLATDRYFSPRKGESKLRWAARKVFSRAFDYQHDYDAFYVVNREMYRESPWYPKIQTMLNLYDTPTFALYAKLLTEHVDLSAVSDYDTVFFGQPLSNFDGTVDRTSEEAMLQKIVGDRRVLVLPHPNEQLDGGNKYDVLPNARIFRNNGAPNDLLLMRLRPKYTITYSSTIGLNYATMNTQSTNYFYPLHRSRVDLLQRYKRFIPNIEVNTDLVIGDDPYAPRSLATKSSMLMSACSLSAAYNDIASWTIA
jgi:hypothetical protein